MVLEYAQLAHDLGGPLAFRQPDQERGAARIGTIAVPAVILARAGLPAQQDWHVMVGIEDRGGCFDLHFQRHLDVGGAFRDAVGSGREEEFRRVDELERALLHDVPATASDEQRFVVFVDVVAQRLDFCGSLPFGRAHPDGDAAPLDQPPVRGGGRSVPDRDGNHDVLRRRDVREIADEHLEGLFSGALAEALLHRRRRREGVPAATNLEPQRNGRGARRDRRRGPALLGVVRVVEGSSEVEPSGPDLDRLVEVVVPEGHAVGAGDLVGVRRKVHLTGDPHRPAVQHDAEGCRFRQLDLPAEADPEPDLVSGEKGTRPRRTRGEAPIQAQRLGDGGRRRGKKRDVGTTGGEVLSQLRVRALELHGKDDLLHAGQVGGRGGPGQRLLAGRLPAAGPADVVALPLEDEAPRGKGVRHVRGKLATGGALRSDKAIGPGAGAEGQRQSSRGNSPTPDPRPESEGRAPARRDDAFPIDLEFVAPKVGGEERDLGLRHGNRLSERRRRSRDVHELTQLRDVVVRNRYRDRQLGRPRHGGERHAPLVHGGREAGVGLGLQFGGVQLHLEGRLDHGPPLERSQDPKPVVGRAFPDSAARHGQLHRWFRIPVEQRDARRYEGAPGENRVDFNGLRSFPEVVVHALDMDLPGAASLALLDEDLVGSAEPVVVRVVSASPPGRSRPREHRALASRCREVPRRLSRGEGGRDGHLHVGPRSPDGLAHRGDVRREDDGSKRLVVRDRDVIVGQGGNPRRAGAEDDRLVRLDETVVDRRQCERCFSETLVRRDGDGERGQSGVVVHRPPATGGCGTTRNPHRDRHVLGKRVRCDRRDDRDLHGAAVLRDLLGGDRQLNAPRRLGGGRPGMDGEQQERDRGDGTRAPACP
ncbi:MAG: hypothetical protein OXF97_04275 [Nitrospira sp.]|nr:hypothetical protein [Nitrospira sp.]